MNAPASGISQPRLQVQPFGGGDGADTWVIVLDWTGVAALLLTPDDSAGLARRSSLVGLFKNLTDESNTQVEFSGRGMRPAGVQCESDRAALPRSNAGCPDVWDLQQFGGISCSGFVDEEWICTHFLGKHQRFGFASVQIHSQESPPESSASLPVRLPRSPVAQPP